MNPKASVKHSIDAVFAVLLFGLFTLLLLMLLLFSAEVYRSSVRGRQENQNLHTAMTYVTTKIRQHDGNGDVFFGELEEIPALCLYDHIDGKRFTTFIYLDDSKLRELFTVPGASVSAELGTVIADLKQFHIEEIGNGFLKLYMEDLDGNSGELLLHPSVPNTSALGGAA